MKGSRLTSAIVGLALLGAASARAEDAAAQMSGWSAADARQGSAALASLSAAGVAQSDISDRMVEWHAKGATPTQCAQLLTALAGAAGQSHEVLAAKGVTSRPDVVLAGGGCAGRRSQPRASREGGSGIRHAGRSLGGASRR